MHKHVREALTEISERTQAVGKLIGENPNLEDLIDLKETLKLDAKSLNVYINMEKRRQKV